MARKQDVLDLVEAAYRPSDGLATWAATLAEEARPLLDQGFGVMCQLIRLDPPATMEIQLATDHAILGEHVLRHDDRNKRRPDLLIHPGRSGLLSLRETAHDASALADFSRDFGSFGVEDLLHITAVDGTDCCLVLGAGRGRQARSVGHPSTWSMVAAHLAGAFRLQRRGLDLLDRPARDSVIFESSIKVAHTEAREPAAVERLRAAVRSIDRARARHDAPELALETWEGLVSGTWSIVDRHDSDGRRYIIAVPNDPEVPDPRGLSQRESQVAALAAAAQSDKLIGYTLGLSRSTVATHLGRAMRKLGVSSRVELASAFAPASEPEVGEESAELPPGSAGRHRRGV